MLKTEKKVEYLELIYDLIFVYVIGRNNTLLHDVENGFVSPSVFFTFLIFGFAVIQIWNFSTFYTNLYGRNSVRDHIFVFINMFLLYFIGDGTRSDWAAYRTKYHIAWALILINIAVQYLIEYRKHKDSPLEMKAIRGMLLVLFGETVLVLSSIIAFNTFTIILSVLGILFGIVLTFVFADKKKAVHIDFPHLTERAMLFVVFTFGEMIIAIAPYFAVEITASSIFFCIMCFLLVVGLFLCYEALYDHIIDRHMESSGREYMTIHIFLIFGLSLITAALVFMRDPEIYIWPKVVMLAGAFLLTYLCMFLLLRFAKPEMKRCRKVIIRAVILSVVYAALMVIFRENMYLNAAFSVIYVAGQYLLIMLFRRQRGLRIKK